MVAVQSLVDGLITEHKIVLATEGLIALQRAVYNNNSITQSNAYGHQKPLVDFLAKKTDVLATTRNTVLSRLKQIRGELWDAFEEQSVSSALEAALDKRKPQSVEAQVLRDALRPHAVALLSDESTSLSSFLDWMQGAISLSQPGGTKRKSNWRKFSATLLDKREESEEFLRCARAGSTLAERLAGIEGLAKCAVGLDVHSEWHSICLQLVRRQFCWPLLSLSLADGHAKFGVSLPVAMHRESDGKKNTQFVLSTQGGGSSQVQGGGDQNGYRFFTGCSLRFSADFFGSTQDALIAAKWLWRTQHGRADDARKNEVEGAGIELDWDYAERCARGLFESLDVSGPSAGAYFSQVFLANLLGVPQPSGLATGELSLRDCEWTIKLVDDIDLKLQYALSVETHERVVLPAAARDDTGSLLSRQVTDALAEGRDAARLEVNYCGTLRSVADAVQTSGWRRATFFRTSEEGRQFYSALGVLFKKESIAPLGYSPLPDTPDENSEQPGQTSTHDDSRRLKNIGQYGDALLTAINVCGQPNVVHLAGTSDFPLHPQAIGYALAWVDNRVRVGDGSYSGAGLGIVCLHVSSTDHPMRFWSRFFRALDVAPSLWRKFQWSDEQCAKAILRAIFENRQCDPAISCTPPPDLVFVVDEAGIEKTRERQFSDDYRCDPWRLLAEGNDLGLTALDASRTPFLGNTRIAIARRETTRVGTANVKEPDDAKLVTILNAVSIFRYGFTVQAAQSLLRPQSSEFLNVTIKALAEWLDALCQIGHLGKFRSEYFVRHFTRRTMKHVAHSATAHVYAAEALAPIIGDNKLAGGTNRDRVLADDLIDEAAWHLQQAKRLTWIRDRQLRTKIENKLSIALRLAANPDWDIVSALRSTLYGHSSALVIARALVQDEIEQQRTPHFSRYGMAIELAARDVKGLAQDTRERRDLLIAEVKHWADAGEKSGGDIASAALLSQHLCFLEQVEGTYPEKKTDIELKREKLRNLILKKLPSDPSDIDKSQQSFDLPLAQAYVRALVTKQDPMAFPLAWSASQSLGEEWDEPWLWLLFLCRHDEKFCNVAKVSMILDAANGFRTDKNAIVSLARTARRRLHGATRDIGTTAALNLFDWLIGVPPGTQLQGTPRKLAIAFVEEFTRESHNCFDFVNRLEQIDLLVTALCDQDGQENALKYLATHLFRNSWGCWALFQRNSVARARAASLLPALAALCPQPWFEAAGEDAVRIGDEVFKAESVPKKYWQARCHAVNFLNNLRCARTLQSIKSDLSNHLSILYVGADILDDT